MNDPRYPQYPAGQQSQYTQPIVGPRGSAPPAVESQAGIQPQAQQGVNPLSAAIGTATAPPPTQGTTQQGVTTASPAQPQMSDHTVQEQQYAALPQQPAIDITETEDELFIYVDLPAFDTDDITLQTDYQTLIITAERDLNLDENHQLIRYERPIRMERLVQLPLGTTGEDASAKYADGVCRIRIPKAESSHLRTIGFE